MINEHIYFMEKVKDTNLIDKKLTQKDFSLMQNDYLTMISLTVGKGDGEGDGEEKGFGFGDGSGNGEGNADGSGYGNGYGNGHE